jgi:probable HAF family extracellular repeat protein
MFRLVVCFAVFALSLPVHAIAQPTVALQESVNIGHPDGAVFTSPFGLNNHGTIAGAFSTADERSHAFVWTERTGFELIWQVRGGGQ